MNARDRRKNWRLVLHKPALGAWNMAVDESILEAVTRRDAPPTLRLYAWEPPCLSLGYAQPITDVDLQKLNSRGWDLVRRPSGGRAILHVDELTYSIIGTNRETIFKGNLVESYRCISQVLLTALQLLGIDASSMPNEDLKKASPANTQEAICFEVPSHYEITVNGKKLIGSAQVRRKSGIIQHGTLPLYGDLTRITQVLAYPNDIAREEAAERVRIRSSTISDILNHQVNWDTAAQTIVSSFEKLYQIQLFRSDLTPPEVHRAEQLVNGKYMDQQWTYKLPSKRD